jgi:hypothetical protein
MEITLDSETELNMLKKAIFVEGKTVTFTPEQTKKIGRNYLIACSKNDQEENARRSEVMKDASQIVVY